MKSISMLVMQKPGQGKYWKVHKMNKAKENHYHSFVYMVLVDGTDILLEMVE